ncbi:hypothetical protein Gpo141_00009043 [Globisporangium polare]
MSVVLSHPGARMPEKIDVLPPPREYMSSSSSSAAAAAAKPRSSKSASMGGRGKKSVNKSASSVGPAQRFPEANNENSSAKSNQTPLVASAPLSREEQQVMNDTSSSATASSSSSSRGSLGMKKDAYTPATAFADEDDDDVNVPSGENNNDGDNDELSDEDLASLLGHDNYANATTTASVKNKNGTAGRSLAGRFSESAVPEKMDMEFVLPPSAKANDGNGFNNNNNRRGGGGNNNFVDFSARDSLASDSGFDAFQFLHLDEGESSRASNSIVTPRSMIQTNPYDDISIEVNNHSINNQGVVMYHVDIKGPEGLLSTYTIRRRYSAFKELHQELQRLISEFAAHQSKENVQAQASADFVSDAFSAENVPDSPHTQARNHQKLQQIAENSVLSASFTFPALPNGGVWSYLKRHDVRLVEQRKKRFEEILSIAIRHPATKSSPMLTSFLSVPPNLISQRGSSYVSLQDYSVPVFDRQRESIERKQLKKRLIEGRRQRTSSEASSSMS